MNMTLSNEFDLEAMRLAKTPRAIRHLSRFVLVALLVLPFALAFVPWTQSVHGVGKAIAFNPVQRTQFIVSPIEGRIKKWYVIEGQHVLEGQRIVEMVDNDPNLELRLLDEERAILDRLRAAEGRVRDIEARVRNLQNSRELAIAVQSSIFRQEEARVQQFDQELIEARASYDAAEPNYRRVKALVESQLGGLASKRDLEVALQQLETASAKIKQAEAKVRLGHAALAAASDGLRKVDADTAAMINLENATRRSAESEVASVRRDKAQIEVRVARQRAQYVDAPCDGIVMRLLANAEQGGILVKPGERLAVLVPDIKTTRLSTRAEQIAGLTSASWPVMVGPSGPLPTALSQVFVAQSLSGQMPLTSDMLPGIVCELWCDGNDLPLVHKGDRVRLQFEGWPAVQFVGWPSVAVGTFGGRVFLIDPSATDKGDFRILVEPDPLEQPWPREQYLRQGVRAQGWILLDEVSLGWEFWRQLNGFPPIRSQYDKAGGQPLGPVSRKVGK